MTNTLIRFTDHECYNKTRYHVSLFDEDDFSETEFYTTLELIVYQLAYHWKWCINKSRQIEYDYIVYECTKRFDSIEDCMSDGYLYCLSSYSTLYELNSKHISLGKKKNESWMIQ